MRARIVTKTVRDSAVEMSILRFLVQRKCALTSLRRRTRAFPERGRGARMAAVLLLVGT